jgi:hypothetical protein
MMNKYRWPMKMSMIVEDKYRTVVPNEDVNESMMGQDKYR